MAEHLAQTTSELHECLGHALESYLNQGMQLPLVLTAVSSNGSVFALRFDQEEDVARLTPTLLAEYTDGPGFILPINIMIADATGDAARIVVNQDCMSLH